MSANASEPPESMRGGAAAKLRRFVERLADPTAYTAVERCLVAVVFMLVGVTVFVLMVEYVDGWPYFPPDVDPALMKLLGRLSRWAIAPWALLLVLCIALRDRAPLSQARARILILATAQLHAITTALFTYLIGPFYSPGWIAFLGGAVMGFLLFERVVTYLGMATFFGLIFVTIVAGHLGTLPYAPLVRGLSRSTGEISLAWSIRMGGTSLVFSSLTLFIASYIITRWRDREQRYELLSKTDALTGITNRRQFMELFERELTRAKRYKTPLACVIVDLDHFKRINDKYGHVAGDTVLIAAALAIQRSVRTIDVVARYGGEEFAILLPNTALEGAEELAARCRRLIEETEVPVDGAVLHVTASLGVASFPDEPARRIEDIIKRADRALYLAKEQGRNRVMTSRSVPRTASLPPPDME